MIWIENMATNCLTFGGCHCRLLHRHNTRAADQRGQIDGLEDESERANHEREGKTALGARRHIGDKGEHDDAKRRQLREKLAGEEEIERDAECLRRPEGQRAERRQDKCERKERAATERICGSMSVESMMGWVSTLFSTALENCKQHCLCCSTKTGLHEWGQHEWCKKYAQWPTLLFACV
jgi:hypothetical protein